MAGRWTSVVPLVSVDVSWRALGADCRLQAIGEREEQTSDALDLLTDLGRTWGPGGDLDRIRGARVGDWTEVSWDTILLLSRGPGRLRIDVQRHRVAKTVRNVRLPGLDARHALAAELVSYELINSGSLAAQVDVGAFRSVANRGIRACFD